MANKKVKYDLDAIILKIQLGQNLTLDEEVFYLEKGFGMTNEDAKRILHISNNHTEGILVD